MGLRVLSWLWRPRLLRALYSQARLAFRLVRDPGVPMLIKAMPLLALGYVVFPLDFIPDVLPVLGELDDLAILLMSLQLFLRLCPESVVEFHRSAIAQGRRYAPMTGAGRIIDAEWRHGA